MCHEGRKSKEFGKIILHRSNTLFKDSYLLLQKCLEDLQICDLYGTFWPFKSWIFISLLYFQLKVLLKIPLVVT